MGIWQVLQWILWDVFIGEECAPQAPALISIPAAVFHPPPTILNPNLNDWYHGGFVTEPDSFPFSHGWVSLAQALTLLFYMDTQLNNSNSSGQKREKRRAVWLPSLSEPVSSFHFSQSWIPHQGHVSCDFKGAQWCFVGLVWVLFACEYVHRFRMFNLLPLLHRSNNLGITCVCWWYERVNLGWISQDHDLAHNQGITWDRHVKLGASLN